MVVKKAEMLEADLVRSLADRKVVMSEIVMAFRKAALWVDLLAGLTAMDLAEKTAVNLVETKAACWAGWKVEELVVSLVARMADLKAA
jgi:hypothetical protein